MVPFNISYYKEASVATAYWDNECGRYGTGESYDIFPKYEDGVETFESEDGLWTCTNLEEGVELLRYNGNEVHLRVPAEIGGKRVVSLESTFDGFIALKSVVIPKGVASIEGAFYGCESLEQVSLPQGVVSLCYAFHCCFALKQIEKPYSQTGKEVVKYGYEKRKETQGVPERLDG